MEQISITAGAAEEDSTLEEGIVPAVVVAGHGAPEEAGRAAEVRGSRTAG